MRIFHYFFAAKTTSKKAASYVQAIDIHPQFDSQSLVLFLRASSFEMDFLTAYRDTLKNKEDNIKKFTATACSIISEMAQLFSQDFGSLNKDKKTKLRDWFLLMKRTLEELELNCKKNAEFVNQIKRRIVQVGEMLDLGGNLSVAQHLQKLESQLDILSALYSELLEEGIRRELALELPSLLNCNDKPGPLEDVLNHLSDTLQSFRRAFIYMCEHVDINGYDMWREEIDALVHRMANELKEKKLPDVSNNAKGGGTIASFFHVCNLLLKYSDPYTNRYLENTMTWCEVKSRKDVLSARTFDLIE
ncbi:unnamed protein product, partial [Strongylus vulgaris]